MNNFRISFFKLKKEQDKNRKMVVVEERYLGSLVIDDNGVTNDFTLQAKAFRHAHGALLYADKVLVERL